VTEQAFFTSVDHLIIGVRDLDAASRSYGEMLGRAPSWSGSHPAYGTRNAIFGLAGSYLEVLALGPDPPRHPVAVALDHFLAARSDGPFALALATPDAAHAAARLRQAGVATAPVAAGEAISSSGARRRWLAFMIAPEDARGINLLGIEHAEPGSIPSSVAVADAASTASAIDHIVIFSDDVGSALRLWRDRLGVAVRWQRELTERGTVNVGLRLGDLTLELVARLGAPLGTRGEQLWGVAYAVGDCAQAVARLRRAGIPVTDPREGLAHATRVATVKWADRSPTLLIEHTARTTRGDSASGPGSGGA